MQASKPIRIICQIIPDSKREAIQLRVWFFLKEWITTVIDDFIDSSDLKMHLMAFLEAMKKVPRDSVSGAAQQLESLFQQQLNGYQSKMEYVVPTDAPPSIIPTGKINSILDIDPLEFARQVTLVKFEVFRKIKPKEFSNLSWTKKNAF